MAVKIEFKGEVKRVYSEVSKSGFESRYIVVSDDSGERPNIIRFRLKQTAQVTIAEGAFVTVSAFVDGREWTNPQTSETRYFTDFTIAKIEAQGAAASASAPAAGKPTKAHDWKTLFAVGDAFGEGRDPVIERAKKLGKPSKQFTPADFQKVADAIVCDHTQPAQPQQYAVPGDFDDAPYDEMPF